MTSEVAILNQQAVALAADSAVTLREEGGQKIFTSALKLFMLSKYQPVGIMIYGNASLLGVPWETIVKSYRKALGSKSFPVLEDYAADFLSFISQHKHIFPDAVQNEYYKWSLYAYFDYIRKDMLELADEYIKVHKQIGNRMLRKIVKQTIEKHYNLWKDSPLLAHVTGDHLEQSLHKHHNLVKDAIQVIFEKLPITKESTKELHYIAASIPLKFPQGIAHAHESGVVFAGFGDSDTFPCVIAYIIDGIVDNIVKCRNNKLKSCRITSTDDLAAVIPFAQSDMVHSFMEGVDPKYQEALEKDFADIFDQYAQAIIDSLETLSQEEKSQEKERIKAAISPAEFERSKKKLEEFRQEHFIGPITKVVAMLPKDELAAMAESLVNLTSFKLKMSMEEETVGGPIDVAVISKGDGFIWIKRKHYFAPELNQHFFSCYYKESNHA